jgi:hypothetical protein
MAGELSGLVSEVLASPLGDVIASVGEGVASAQRALDEAAVAQTLEIYSEGGEELVRMLRDIGYRPTFYALPETVGEVNVSLRLSSGATAAATSGGAAAAIPGAGTRIAALSPAARVKTYVTPVDAGFANRYNFDATASAKLTFKIVPVPPLAGVDDLRIVPDLVGRTLAVAREVLDALDLDARAVDAQGQPAEAADTAEIAGTTPAAGAVARLGTAIDLVVK